MRRFCSLEAVQGSRKALESEDTVSGTGPGYQSAADFLCQRHPSYVNHRSSIVSPATVGLRSYNVTELTTRLSLRARFDRCSAKPTLLRLPFRAEIVVTSFLRGPRADTEDMGAVIATALANKAPQSQMCAWAPRTSNTRKFRLNTC